MDVDAFVFAGPTSRIPAATLMIRRFSSVWSRGAFLQSLFENRQEIPVLARQIGGDFRGRGSVKK